jgi:hypothetical protein
MSQSAVNQLLIIAADIMSEPPVHSEASATDGSFSRRSLLFTVLHAFLALLIAGAWEAFAQPVPTTASITRWDIHAVTGGTPAEGTHKLSGIDRDSRGNVWVIGQGAGNVRVGRIATADLANTTYTEWTVFRNGEDGEPRGLLVTPNDDVWLAVDGTVPFVRKLADTDTFVNFKRQGALMFSPRAMTLAADGSSIFVAGADQTGQGFIVTIDTTVAAGGDVMLPAWAAPPAERDRFKPQYVAIDSTPGIVWFTNSPDPLSPVSTVGRLDLRTGQVLEWPLNGLDAAGLDVNGSQVCVAMRGFPSQPQIQPGDVECLVVPADDPATAANEMATTPATRRRFNRFADQALDMPEQIVSGGASSLFLTERGGNAVVFIGAGALTDATDDPVTPTAMQLESAPLDGFHVEDSRGPNVPRLTVQMPPTSIAIDGTSIGSGQTSFELPAAVQQTPEWLVRYPHPAAITRVYRPNDRGGYGTMYVAESFHDLRGDTYSAARVDKFELAVPFITVTDADGDPVSAVSFSADVQDASAPAAELIVRNGGRGALDWLASVEATGFSVAVTPVDSGVLSESESAAIVLTPTIPAAAGGFAGTLTISSQSALEPVVIPITFTVTRPAALSVDRTQLTFQTNRDMQPRDTVRLTNAPNSRVVNWAASAPSWLTVGPSNGTLAGGDEVEVTVTVDPAGLPLDVPQTVDVTFFDAANPSAPDTRAVVTLTVTVTAPRIVLGQTRVELPAMEQAGTSTHNVTLTNAGTGPLNPVIVVTPGATWLTASLPGSTPIPAGQSRTLTIGIDTVGLAPGIYNATVSVSDGVAADLPLHLFQPGQQITVSVEVTSPTPPAGEFVIVPATLTFDAKRWTVCNGKWAGSNPPSQRVVLTNNTDRPVWFLGVPSEPWLRIAPFWGVVLPRKTLTLSVSVDATGLVQRAYAGKLTFYTLTHPSHGRVISSRVVPVRLNVGAAAASSCVPDRKPGGHRDRDDDDDRCRGDHDRDGDHDDDDHKRHRHGRDRD